MRHASLTLGEEIGKLYEAGQRWDVLFCTEMMNLAELKGLLPAGMRGIPSVVYFHENQLTYPGDEAQGRDLHYAFTHLMSGAVAEAVWFNSGYHRDLFFDALAKWVRKMPDYAPVDVVQAMRGRSGVYPPGVDAGAEKRLGGAGLRADGDGLLRLLWAARWEDDKRADVFFEALRLLRAKTERFRVSVVGRSFGEVPGCFAEAREALGGLVEDWGYVESRAGYEAVLDKADVVVSTAAHEFFGIAMVEAVARGAWGVLARGVSYPEIFGEGEWLHDGSAEDVAEKLYELIERRAKGTWDVAAHEQLVDRARGYDWGELVGKMDAGLVSMRM